MKNTQDLDGKRLGLKASGLTIEYVDDISSFAMPGVHVFILGTTNAMRISNEE